MSCSVYMKFLVKAEQLNYYTLNVRSQGKQLVLFPSSPDVSRDEVEGNIRTRGKTKLTGFPRDLTLSILLYF